MGKTIRHEKKEWLRNPKQNRTKRGEVRFAGSTSHWGDSSEDEIEEEWFSDYENDQVGQKIFKKKIKSMKKEARKMSHKEKFLNENQ